MKSTKHIMIAIMGMMLIISCSSSQTFIVQGTPGTIITDPNDVQLGVIESSGTTNITLERDSGYPHFLQAKSPGTQRSVPFALDYKNRFVIPEDFATGIGGVLFYGGCATVVVGGIGGMCGSTAMARAALWGLGGVVVGFPMFLNGSFIDRVNYNYNFNGIQTTNEDLLR